MEVQSPELVKMKSNHIREPRSHAVAPFRNLIPPPDHSKIKGLTGSSPLSWADQKRAIPELEWFLKRFELRNLDRPYLGFTTDGSVRDGVFDYANEDGAPTDAMVGACERLLSVLSAEQRTAVSFESVDADEMRIWSNPELYLNPGGLRLDECTEEIQVAVHHVLQASLSPAGYTKVLGCCLTNDFLGGLIDGKRVLNKHSYNFRLFGQPSTVHPWAYTFFGHHVCLAVFVQGSRMVIGPTFLGAEPDHIDEGPHEGLRLFGTEEHLSLQLMQNLSPELQDSALLSENMDGKFLPEGRWNPFDERHLGGASQDNRIVPFEGCRVSLLSTGQQEHVISLFEAFNEYYPARVLAHRVRMFKAHLDETYFAWIGGFGEDDPYYYRVHSPITFMEFDFHCGVFLTNTTPAKCHIHTINRLPNRGDYGKALLAQYHNEHRGQHCRDRTLDVCEKHRTRSQSA